MPHVQTLPAGLVDLILRFLFFSWLATSVLATTLAASKGRGRFFNDSAKSVEFYVDDQFVCSVPANPEQNNAYCDAEIVSGEHKISIKGLKLTQQFCNVLVGKDTNARHAEANFSNGGHLHCFSVGGILE